MPEQTRGSAPVDVDLVVIGDGPAGLALGAHASLLGMKVAVIGPGAPWSATYGVWVDEIEADPIIGPRLNEVFAARTDRIVVWGNRRHELGRRYAVIHNMNLRQILVEQIRSTGGQHLAAQVTDVTSMEGHSRVMSTDGEMTVGHVCDASGVQGWRSGARAAQRLAMVPAWQTAYGVVVDEVPADAAVSVDLPTLMDFRLPIDATDTEFGAPTFCYVIPTGKGWLVEETVLAARQPVEPELLRDRLIARLGPSGADIVRTAEREGRIETVRIPMGGSVMRHGEQPIPFGAAAGMIHPATGYSVTAALRAAPRLARALATGRDPWDAVAPRGARGARRLHQYGAEVLVSMSQTQIAEFFDTFFDLPVARWQAYLRVDSSPGELMAAMARVFRAASPRTRRALMTADPRSLRLR
jgi:lycopene beta-cyclase